MFGKPYNKLHIKNRANQGIEQEWASKYTTKLAPIVSPTRHQRSDVWPARWSKACLWYAVRSFLYFCTKVGGSMSFSRNFWCSSSDSSASFAIDAEETKCDEFRHFTKFKYVELKFLFFFFFNWYCRISTGWPQCPSSWPHQQKLKKFRRF